MPIPRPDVTPDLTESYLWSYLPGATQKGGEMRSSERLLSRVRWLGALAVLGALLWTGGANWPHA